MTFRAGLQRMTTAGSVMCMSPQRTWQRKGRRLTPPAGLSPDRFLALLLSSWTSPVPCWCSIDSLVGSRAGFGGLGETLAGQ
jgi:hypothetical protein